MLLPGLVLNTWQMIPIGEEYMSNRNTLNLYVYVIFLVRAPISSLIKGSLTINES